VIPYLVAEQVLQVEDMMPFLSGVVRFDIEDGCCPTQKYPGFSRNKIVLETGPQSIPKINFYEWSKNQTPI